MSTIFFTPATRTRVLVTPLFGGVGAFTPPITHGTDPEAWDRLLRSMRTGVDHKLEAHINLGDVVIECEGAVEKDGASAFTMEAPVLACACGAERFGVAEVPLDVRLGVMAAGAREASGSVVLSLAGGDPVAEDDRELAVLLGIPELENLR